MIKRVVALPSINSMTPSESEQLELPIGTLFSEAQPKPFRPIHYLGSKLRLIDKIKLLTRSVAPAGAKFCDVFSGSGTVSFAMSQNYDVTSIDIQEYSRVISLALGSRVRPTSSDIVRFISDVSSCSFYRELNSIFLEAVTFENEALLEAITESPRNIVAILEQGSIKISPGTNLPYFAKIREGLQHSDLLNSNKALVASCYGGIYFSYQQAVAIDAIRHHIDSIQDQDAKPVYLAALLSAVSDCVNTIGKHFAQPIKPIRKDGSVKQNLIRKIISDRKIDFLSLYRSWLLTYGSLPCNKTKGIAIKGDYAEELGRLKQRGVKFDVIYADPPYTRDHYSRYYHLLETVCLRDNPELSTSTISGVTSISRGLYRKDRHQSPFCIKRQAPVAFRALFGAARRFDCPLILSYSPFSKANDDHPRLMDTSQITAMGSSFYKFSTVSYCNDFTHSKLNSTLNNKNREEEAEVLITFFP